jgi:hypothetical protein
MKPEVDVALLGYDTLDDEVCAALESVRRKILFVAYVKEKIEGPKRIFLVWMRVRRYVLCAFWNYDDRSYCGGR